MTEPLPVWTDTSPPQTCLIAPNTTELVSLLSALPGLELIRVSDDTFTLLEHTRSITLRIVETYPDHEPREDNPYYKYFNATRRRLKKEGKLRCWICDTDQKIELHHSVIEYSLINGVDLDKFKIKYPDSRVENDDDFQRWCQEDGNMMPLCKYHHVGPGGVHVLPMPQWLIQRVWKSDIEVPAKYVKAMGLGEVVFLRDVGGPAEEEQPVHKPGHQDAVNCTAQL